MRRQNVDPLEDPDFTLFVRVQDLGGDSETALSGTSRVHIVVEQNLWNNPGPLTVKENLKETYPLVIAKVCQDTHSQIYTLTLTPSYNHPTLDYPLLFLCPGPV